MIRISIGLMCMALTTLMLELTLIRVFDVIWYSNMSYMVITLAMFCFGLSGVYSSLRPLRTDSDVRGYLARLAFLFAVFAMVILPAMNLLPFDFDIIYSSPLKGMLYFMVMYFFLIIPFFLSGLIFTTVFSVYAGKIQRLYCWDLAGAAVGCLFLIPFLPPIGPGGIIFVVSGIGLLASGCFSTRKNWTTAVVAIALLMSAIPFTRGGYFEFRDHINKRGVKSAMAQGRVELSHWDPISKIEVIDLGNKKHIAYDGGSQSSFIFPFDGDFKKLLADVEHARGRHFTGSNVYLAQALKRNSQQDVLIIGAAGGQETKAALMYGARHVDAVELVGYVVQLGKTTYADYNGNIYNNPKVNAIKGEGRSFLRATNKKYDIIQMFSNHTSSSIAAGTGAMATTYLQTAEAYKEYFSHLKADGILQINHHIYPKMVATAALAWKEMGRKDFRKHVVVFEARPPIQDNLPTMLIRMTPWTEKELKPLRTYFPPIIQMVVDPGHPEKNMLSAEFFSGSLSAATLERVPFRVEASTDNQPYFNFIRKSFHMLKADPKNFMNYSTAALLDSQLKNGKIPSDVIHLLVTGIASIFFTVVFILIPMFFSRAGKERWPGKLSSLVYFSCLGAGFIIFELVFIQIFMKLIGYPLYTYSAVVFALLLAAGIGSAVSAKLGISPARRWSLPFVGILLSSLVLLLVDQPYFELFLQAPVLVRIAAACALIFPVGFFMGMPFPLGILSLERQPRGAIAWAWAMNGLFTVIGGIFSVVLSIYCGFRLTLIVAMLIYFLALLVFSRLRTAAA